MIVKIRVDDLAAMEELADVADPDLGLALAVHDDFVPGLRLPLDAFPVADPADLSDIGSQHVQLFGDGYPDLIISLH